MERIADKTIIEPSSGREKRRAREVPAEARNFIYLAVCLFFVGTLIGLGQPERFEPLLTGFEDYVEHRFMGKSLHVTILLIFIQNFTACLVSLVLGVVFGLVPALSAMVNGVLLGTVISALAGAGRLHELWKIIPHGIFELPAIFIAWGTGMWYGAWILRRDKSETLGSRGRRAILAFMKYCAPLLMVAALIEGVLISA